MKIAFVYDVIYPYVIGGAEKRIFEISQKLSKNHEVHLIGMKFWKGKDVVKKGGVYFHGVCPARMYLYNKFSQRNIIQPLYFSYHLFKKLVKEDFDIIDCQNFPYFPCFVAKFYSVLKKKPLVITWLEVWGDYWTAYLGLKGVIGKVVENLSMNLTKDNISISKHTAKRLKTSSTVIPVSVDLKKISAVKPSKEKFDVLFAGRLMREKRVDLLIKALEGTNIKLGVIGDGPEKKELQILALGQNVRFLGFLPKQEQVYAYMKSSKVFVSPSIREGFGTTVLEALACGCPVITVKAENNASADLVRDGENGFVVEALEEKILEKVVFTLNNHDLRKKMKKNAIKSVQSYDLKTMVAGLEDFYKKRLK